MKIKINSTINPTCELCKWKIGRVAVACDTHTEFYCPECYIKRFLPKVTLVMSNTEENTELTIGTGYYIADATTDLTAEEKSYRGSEFRDIKPYINRVVIVGKKIGVSGRVAKTVRIEWKDEYKNHENIKRYELDREDTVVNLEHSLRRITKYDREQHKTIVYL